MPEDLETNEQQETGREKLSGEPVASGSADKEKQAAQIVADFFDAPAEAGSQAKPEALLGETPIVITPEETTAKNLSVISEILGRPVTNESLAGKKETAEILSQPDFHDFLSAMIGAGYKPTENDLFPSSRRIRSRLFEAYINEAFKTGIIKENNILLAKYLNLFKSPYWDFRSFESLMANPNVLENIKTLERKFGYHCDTESDDGVENLARLLSDQRFVNDFFRPETELVFNVLKNLGYEFDITDANTLVRFTSDSEFLSRASNPAAAQLMKSLPPHHSLEFIWTLVDLFARINVTLQPVVTRLVGEFGHTFSASIFKHVDEFEKLRDNPQVFEAATRLKEMGAKLDPMGNFSELKIILEHNLFSIVEHYKDSPDTQGFIIKNVQQIAAIPPEKLGVYMEIFHKEDSPRVRNFIANNLEHIAAIPPEKFGVYLDIFYKIDDSPSQEIQRVKHSLLAQLLQSSRPVEDYQKIESIFIKNNIPSAGKVYGVFETLYDPKVLKHKISERTSPVLKQASTRKRYYTIYQDLLKVHIESGNRSMKEYAEVLQSGGRLIQQYERDGIDSLSPREQEQLRYFVGKLETLQAKSALDTADDAFQAAGVSDFGERFKHVREGLKVAEGQTVLERISEMYLRPAGLSSLDELLERMRVAKASADQRSRQIVAEAKQSSPTGEPVLELKSGDFLKGVNANFIGNILQNGSVAKEFLGESSDSDSTPLDTDISLVTPEDAEGGLANVIKSSLANGYGEIMFALKDRGQYQRTTLGQPAHAESGKMELFQTGVLGSRHYGIRTGFAATEIDFMIVKDTMVSKPKQMEKLFFEISQNGYYLPVTNESGKVIFTPEMYDEYRQYFSGLEKFDGPEFAFHPITPSERSYDRVSEIASKIPEDSKRVKQVTQTIRSQIEQSLGSFGVGLRPEFDTSILGAELLDTGSTGRHTNTPGDFDFDFSLKLDAKDFPRAAELAQAIKGIMTFTEDNSHQEAGGYYQLRVKGVTSIGGQQLEKPLDIDIGFASKSDLSVYGSHDAIRDKLNYIKNHNGQQAYEQAIANVILTKQVLKEGHAYKKQEDGGFGGVGVENWILANGGNMEEAFKNFRNAAYENGQRLPYEKFREKYKILDPGTNIKFSNHDNFINVLKSTGYEAMLNAIDNYLKLQPV